MTTLKDVAKIAGVTVTTVSRVLNNRGYISHDTRSKVMSAMKTLDYQPNEVARSLIFQRSRIIGLIVPSVSHPFFGELANAIEYEASKRGYKILLANSRHDADKENSYLDMLKRNKVDGIILASRTVETKPFLNVNLPLLSFDRELSPDIPMVSADNTEGGRLVARHLIARGCKNLLYIGGSGSVRQYSNNRGNGFIEACEQARMPCTVYETEEVSFNSQQYEASIGKALDAHPKVDGIFASSDVIAAQVIRMLSIRGKRVPQDVKIVGFDDVQIASLLNPALTTVRQPVEAMAIQMLELLERKMKGAPAPAKTIMPVELIIRDST
ncbi:MAG: LacI family DNA-binding transcriptional regulator [Eubacteriales bacterium]|nr:LacI family DNA-binding transcriptional regulator [Eubacteriales bacterium]